MELSNYNLMFKVVLNRNFHAWRSRLLTY